MIGAARKDRPDQGCLLDPQAILWPQDISSGHPNQGDPATAGLPCSIGFRGLGIPSGGSRTPFGWGDSRPGVKDPHSAGVQGPEVGHPRSGAENPNSAGVGVDIARQGGAVPSRDPMEPHPEARDSMSRSGGCPAGGREPQLSRDPGVGVLRLGDRNPNQGPWNPAGKNLGGWGVACGPGRHMSICGEEIGRLSAQTQPWYNPNA